jgi:heme-degrading monooxygenase HmoA
VKYGDGEVLMGTCFSTTDWHLKDGQREEFVDRWTTFLKWTRETQEGFESARLVADEANPHHFLSVGEWRDSTARQTWADEPRFLELFMPCLEACDDVQTSQYAVKVTF